MSAGARSQITGRVILDFRNGSLIGIMPIASSDEQASSLLQQAKVARPDTNALRVLTLLNRVIRHAREYHDGHFFLLSFTTGYKGNFGTPDLDNGSAREEVWKLPAFGSIEELLEYMLEQPSCGCIRLTGGHV